jgi:hypothetical protein
MPQPFPSWSASTLRRDLSARAQHLAHTHNLLHDECPSSNPTILFGHDDHNRHGNFHPASYAAICAKPDWQRRLTKPHTASRRSRARNDWRWMELDSCNSSDALLMNIFCHPAVFNGQTLAPAVANLLNVDPTAQPNFGINPNVPLKTLRKTRGKKLGAPSPALSLSKGPDSGTWVLEPSTESSAILTDRTEIDLQLGNLFLEAKLTESNFQTAAPRLIERYRDLETVFDLTRLPKKILSTPPSHPPVEDYSLLEEHESESDVVNLYALKSARIFPAPPPLSIATKTRTAITGYQLIRNVLAAYAADASFCVLSDARRHDLIETWYAILSAVHRPTFATRLKLLTWQELATTLPSDLQQFLEAKYGIVPA